MLAAIVGAKLQGLEAVYLARKAGWDIRLIDRRARPPASTMVDRFVCLDVRQQSALDRALSGVDIVIPALENKPALSALVQHAHRTGIPLAFDAAAYDISSSKKRSDRLFIENRLPVPDAWPDCGMPVMAKPSQASGSEGVRLFYDPQDLAGFMKTTVGEWVYQSFLEGPTFSLEVIGGPEAHTVWLVTDLEMDSAYDCKRVLAPSVLAPEWVLRFEALALDIARLLPLAGLMDVEVVRHGNRLNVLEIDARLPSQTPSVVYASTGINLLAVWADYHLSGRVVQDAEALARPRGVILEHVQVSSGQLAVRGEHIMSQYGPLTWECDFFGADEAIVSSRSSGGGWVATLIIKDVDRKTVWAKRNAVIRAIQHHCGIQTVLDEAPGGPDS